MVSCGREGVASARGTGKHLERGSFLAGLLISQAGEREDGVQRRGRIPWTLGQGLCQCQQSSLEAGSFMKRLSAPGKAA